MLGSCIKRGMYKEAGRCKGLPHCFVAWDDYLDPPKSTSDCHVIGGASHVTPKLYVRGRDAEVWTDWAGVLWYDAGGCSS